MLGMAHHRRHRNRVSEPAIGIEHFKTSRRPLVKCWRFNFAIETSRRLSDDAPAGYYRDSIATAALDLSIAAFYEFQQLRKLAAKHGVTIEAPSESSKTAESHSPTTHKAR